LIDVLADELAISLTHLVLDWEPQNQFVIAIFINILITITACDFLCYDKKTKWLFYFSGTLCTAVCACIVSATRALSS